MTPILVQINLPDGSTRRQVCSTPVVRFGREAENGLILAHQVVSRFHGELRFEDGVWMIHNLSPNGTLVNGKRVGKRGYELESGDVVLIGEQEVFRVKFDAARGAQLPEEAEKAPPPDQAALAASVAKRKARLYIGIGIWLIVILAVLLFFNIGGPGKAADKAPPQLDHTQIVDAILARPGGLPATVGVDEREAQKSLDQANAFYSEIEKRTDAVYQAYSNFQMALIYSGKKGFDSPMDQRHYNELQQRLIDEVDQRYRAGYLKLQSNDLSGSEKVFQKLLQYYPDVQSPVYSRVQELLRVILERKKNSGTQGPKF